MTRSGPLPPGEPAITRCVYLITGLLLAMLIRSADGISVGPTHYDIRSDSTLSSDGSIERSVVQPMTFTSKGALVSEAWQRPADAAGSNREFKATGRFDSVEEMPAYYEFHGELEGANAELRNEFIPSTLERNYARIDHVFAIEHRWQEHLTNGPRLVDMLTALREGMEWSLALQRDVLKAGLRPGYDASPYLEWYRTRLARMAEDLVLLDFELAAHVRNGWEKPRALQRAWEQTLVDSPADIDQESLESVRHQHDARRWILLSFLANLFGFPEHSRLPFGLDPEHFIRRTDGQPPGMTTPGTIWRNDADSAIEALIDEKYAGDEGLSRQQIIFMVRVLGPYVMVSGDFLFTMSMPGSIVDTNGETSTDDRVTWSFTQNQGSPLGYTMYARSVEPAVEIQQILMGSQPLMTPGALADFADLVAEDELLREWLQESRDTGQLLPKAAVQIGEHYRKRNSPQMWSWYCYAATKGHWRALHKLGLWHESDTDLSSIGSEAAAALAQDDRAAYVWYSVAESMGHLEESEDRKRVFLEKLTPREREEAKQMREAWTPDKCPWPGS